MPAECCHQIHYSLTGCVVKLHCPLSLDSCRSIFITALMAIISFCHCQHILTSVFFCCCSTWSALEQSILIFAVHCKHKKDPSSPIIIDPLSSNPHPPSFWHQNWPVLRLILSVFVTDRLKFSQIVTAALQFSFTCISISWLLIGYWHMYTDVLFVNITLFLQHLLPCLSTGYLTVFLYFLQTDVQCFCTLCVQFCHVHYLWANINMSVQCGQFFQGLCLDMCGPVQQKAVVSPKFLFSSGCFPCNNTALFN